MLGSPSVAEYGLGIFKPSCTNGACQPDPSCGAQAYPRPDLDFLKSSKGTSNLSEWFSHVVGMLLASGNTVLMPPTRSRCHPIAISVRSNVPRMQRLPFSREFAGRPRSKRAQSESTSKHTGNTLTTNEGRSSPFSLLDVLWSARRRLARSPRDRRRPSAQHSSLRLSL